MSDETATTEPETADTPAEGSEVAVADTRPGLWRAEIFYEGTPEQHEEWMLKFLELPESERLTVSIHAQIFTPDELEADPVYDNPAERALSRLEQPDPFATHKKAPYVHGYRAAIRYAQRILIEELNRNHGI